jgi:sulfur relay (sulfurtransferase) DsrF/TusC family protein
MAKYLLIESRDPFESNEVTRTYNFAMALSGAGNEVTLFLVQNGVLPTRSGAQVEGLAEVAGSDVTVLADDFSLRERAIGAGQLAAGIAAAPLEVVIDQLADGVKAIWH